MNKFFVVPILAALLIVGVPAFAEDHPQNVDLTCMKSAIEKREDAIIAVKEKAFASFDAAFKVRRDGLSAAWSISVAKDRRAAITTAWSAFKTSYRTAHMQLRTDDKAAWSAFKTDRKACKVDSSSSSSDKAGEKIDASTL